MDDTDGGIDFGDDENGGDEIDWGTVDMGEEIAITIEEAGLENPEGGVASGNEALSVLENTPTRNVFIDELLEVRMAIFKEVDNNYFEQIPKKTILFFHLK